MIRSAKMAFWRFVWLSRLTLWGVVMLVGASVLPKAWGDLQPLDRWYKVYRLWVTDTCEGEQPLVYIEREILKPFTAAVAMKVTDPDDDSPPVCSSSPTFPYSPKQRRVIVYSLSDYMDRRCELKPGTYRLYTVRTVERPGYWPKQAAPIVSEPFRILQKSSPACARRNP